MWEFDLNGNLITTTGASECSNETDTSVKCQDVTTEPDESQPIT